MKFDVFWCCIGARILEGVRFGSRRWHIGLFARDRDPAIGKFVAPLAASAIRGARAQMKIREDG
jgi:hypothetical protein